MSKPRSKRESSILALFELLSDLANMKEIPAEKESIILLLSSQHGMAKIHMPDRAIIPCSLNSLKSYADKYLPGGFKQLDSMRAKLLNSLRPSGLPSRGSRLDLEAKISQLTAAKNTLHEDLLILTKALHLCLEACRHYAASSNNPKIIELCRIDCSDILLLTSRARHVSAKAPQTISPN